jgi:hypothetical protein
MLATEQIALPPMSGPQIALLEAVRPDGYRYVELEGSPGSAKSWGGAFLIWKLAYEHPGIQLLYCRYKDQDVRGQLMGIWEQVAVFFPAYLQPTWDPPTESWRFPNGSRCYMHSLKSSEITAVHSKYKGKTLAVIVIEEAAEVPYVHLVGLRERLRQSRTPKGEAYRYPLAIVFITNCVDEDHWLAVEFPADNRDPDHLYIRADIYSNAHNLGPDAVAGYELDYPIGHVLRPTKIEGRRGVTLVGKPVYQGYFDRRIHVSRAVHVNPYYPLLEGWDFGHEKPAVVWCQYLAHLGAIQILGAVKGHDVFVETFAPAVLKIRARWFPHQANIQSWCDPAGATNNGGSLHTPVRLLQDLGVPVRYTQEANDQEVRYAAIQVIAGYMERLGRDGAPAFQMHPQCLELVRDGAELRERETELLVQAFEVGYIWDEKAISDAHPNIRKPKKGTRFDDLQNSFEYVITGESLSVPLRNEMLRAEQRLSLVAQRLAAQQAEQLANRAATGPTGETLRQAAARIAQQNKVNRDIDPQERQRARTSLSRGRGGWGG